MASQLSVADRVRIMEIISDYALTLDGGHLDEYVGSFTPDASLTNRTGSYDGEAVIRDYVGHLIEIGQVGPASGIRHFIGLPVLRGDGESCHATSYLAIPGSNPAGAIETYLVGVYELDFVKVDGDWRFKVRHSSMALTGPSRQSGEPITDRSCPARRRPDDTMSAEDKLAVIDMLAGYAFLLDGGDAEGYADNFLPDGVFDGGGGPVQGREAIVALVKSIVERSQAGNYKTRHMMGLPSIRGDLNRCEAESYILLFRQEAGGPIEIRIVGRYSDQIVKDGDRWHFARRTYNPQLPASR